MDEIRKTAEDKAWSEFAVTAMGNLDAPIELVFRRIVSTAINDAIREDRKRRDSLEAMLVELVTLIYGCSPMFKIDENLLAAAPYDSRYIGSDADKKNKHYNGFYDTPSEAVRAALRELKGSK